MKRKRQLIEELEWKATIIDHEEIKEEEQAQNEWLRQCEQRKMAFRVKKQTVLAKADELRNDGLEEEEPCLSDSDVEILNKDPSAESRKEPVVSRVDSGRAIREARKDNPIPSVEFSRATKSLAPAPPVVPASLPAVVAATTPQAIPSSSQPSFAPIRPPMSYLLKLKLKKLKSVALTPSGEDHTSDSERGEPWFPRSSQSSHSSQLSQSSPTSLSFQSSQFPKSKVVATESTQFETCKDATSVPAPKPGKAPTQKYSYLLTPLQHS